MRERYFKRYDLARVLVDMIKNHRVTGTLGGPGGETGVYSSQDLWLSGRNLLRRARMLSVYIK